MSARPAYYYRNQQYFVCWSRNSAETWTRPSSYNKSYRF